MRNRFETAIIRRSSPQKKIKIPAKNTTFLKLIKNPENPVKLTMDRKRQNFSELIREQNEAYDELLARDLAERESFAALERRMGDADDLLGPEPDFVEELEASKSPGIVVIRIYTPQGLQRRRFRAKSPDRLLNAIHLYLESLGYFEEENPVLSTFDRGVMTTQNLKDFLAKGGGALYLNKEPQKKP